MVIIIIIIIIKLMRTAAPARPRAHNRVHRGRAREPPQILINGQHAPAGSLSAAEAADMRQVDVPDEAWADHVHGPYRVGMPVFWSDVSVQLEKAFKEL